MKNYCNNEKGFTLIELIISMTITVIILTGLFNLMLYSSKIFNKQNDEVYNQQHLREVAIKISKYVMEGTSTQVYSSNDFGIDGKYRIYLDTDKIIRIKDLTNGSNQPISTEVESFYVHNVVEGKTIKITIADNNYVLDTMLTPRNN